MGEINHPGHYNACGEKDEDGSVPFEPIKVIEEWGFGEGFCLGNAIKYIIRAPYKGTEEKDLRKALWYLERLRWSTVPRHNENLCDPRSVAEAWKLPGPLAVALEAIMGWSPSKAADAIRGYLEEIRR
jgi:hypothetical protein